jgi:hypothetical protein
MGTVARCLLPVGVVILGEALRQQDQLREANVEDFCDAAHRAPSRIRAPGLDVGDPGRVDLGKVTEFLLAEVPFSSQPANRSTECWLGFYAARHS